MSFSIDLDEQTAAVVQELAAKENLAPAQVIHDALAAYTGKRKRPLPRAMDKFSSGQADLAQRDEDLLREAQLPSAEPTTTPMRFDDVKHILSDKPLRHAEQPASRPA
ncbi:MAG TPA: hypothetical protein VND64_30755 [Pirellulales bacterium]|nr:hypothetical protein [Pirellulales bacterium]